MAHRVILIAVPRIQAIRWYYMVNLVVAHGACPQVVKTRDNGRQKHQDHQERFQVGREPALEWYIKNGLFFGCR